MKSSAVALALIVPFLAGCGPGPAKYDVVIRHGTVYDGTGAPGKAADVAILDDRIAAVGDLAAERGREEVDATGLAGSPGVIKIPSPPGEGPVEGGPAPGNPRPSGAAGG